MKKFEILFGGLCGFYFDDHGDDKGRLHAILVDSKRAMGGMPAHAPSLVFAIDDIDLDASDPDFEVIMDPSGKAFGRWDLFQLRVYLDAEGKEVVGTWTRPVPPKNLFQLADADPIFGKVDERCLEANPRKYKAVACRTELAGGNDASLVTAEALKVDWIYKPGNKPEGKFARTLRYTVTQDASFFLRLEHFYKAEKWKVAFKAGGSVSVTNFPVKEDYEHFKAYFDLHRDKHPRGFPRPKGKQPFGVRTGCIPNGFSGKV